MRTFILSLIIVLGTVAGLVQTVVAGYDRQFTPPGPVRAWQVREQGDGGEVVTVWGQSCNVPADELPALAGSACTYVERLPGVVRELLGAIRWPGKAGQPGFADQAFPAVQQDNNQKQ